MSLVQLRLGSVELALTREGLQRYPDSLLSTMLAPNLAQTSSSTHKLYLNVDPEQVPDNPVTTWNLAPTIVAALYDSAPSSPAWDEIIRRACHSMSQHVSFAQQLSELLDYLNLPGPVSKWLPPVYSISMEFPRLLAFHNTCNAMEQAAAAVQHMMQYKPHAEKGRPTDGAVFLLIAKTGDYLPVLRTHVFSARTTEELFSTSSSPVVANTSYMPRLPDRACYGSDIVEMACEHKKAGNAMVGENHAVFGCHVRREVQAVRARTGLNMYCRTVTIEFKTCCSGCVASVPVWLAKW